ncbi:hypothetical protein, partial [Mycobacteroides abscessus]|uniref:hypothetical protein n=1 Tax=Mycobacteroides abscessus TaxID=36809 RepID=UPI000AF8E513
DQTFDIQIILGKVRPFLRRLAEAHPQVLIIARPTLAATSLRCPTMSLSSTIFIQYVLSKL